MPNAIKYPYYEPVVIHYSYNLDPPQNDVVQVFSVRPLPSLIQTQLKTYALSKGLSDNPNCSSMVWDFQPTGIQYSSTNFANQVWGFLAYKYKDTPTDTVHAISDGDRVFMLNDTTIAERDVSLKTLSYKLVDGANTITLQDSYQPTNTTTTKLPLLTVKVINSSIDLKNCYVKLSRNGYADKYIPSGYTIGATVNNENPLKPGEVITLGLYLKSTAGIYSPLPNPVWEMNNHRDTVATESLTIPADLQQFGVYPNPQLESYGNVEEILIGTNVAPPAGSATGTGIIADVSKLTNGNDSTTAKARCFRSCWRSCSRRNFRFIAWLAKKSITHTFCTRYLWRLC